MPKPLRIQLSRRKGFNLQVFSRALNGLTAVKVDRSTPYGNPFPVGSEGPLGRVAHDNAGACGFFAAMRDDPELRAGYPSDETLRHCLGGYNLACWCNLCDEHRLTGKPADVACSKCEQCHVDVLLDLANPATQPSP